MIVRKVLPMIQGMDTTQDARAHTLRSIRAVLGLKQEELAEAAGITARTLASLESGDTAARVGTLESLARAITKRGFPITAAEVLEAVQRENNRRAAS